MISTTLYILLLSRAAVLAVCLREDVQQPSLNLRSAPTIQANKGSVYHKAAALRNEERDSAQCFPWSSTSSIARESIEYPDAATGEARHAVMGDLISLQCEGVVCPNPQVPDCYMNEGVCGDDEWCMLADELRFGPWAVAPGGETPNFGNRDCEFLRQHGFDQLFSDVCAHRTDWGPWPAVRGRCVKYRKEQQSCKPAFGSFQDQGGALDPHYAVDPLTGRPPARPLLCAPGLVCTGDVEPIPFTCVKARPPNTCYLGPWWDSASWCRSSALSAEQLASGGLPRRELEAAAQALIIQLPVDVYHGPSNPKFWDDPAAVRARELISNIVQTLWPELYRAVTTFPLPLPDPRAAKGSLKSAEWNQTAADAEKLYRQTNKVWSAVHTLIHNCRDPLPAAQVKASRALAVWLRQHFMCCNCRGFWATDVLDVIGLPPTSTSREEHKVWWWKAHNMVSEHTAATRGGHPWIWPGLLTDQEFSKAYGRYSDRLRCQNPWFVPFQTAEEMWTMKEGVKV